jgi:hypothetical protein
MRASQSSRSSASCLAREDTVKSLSWKADEFPLEPLLPTVKFSSERLDDKKLIEKYSGMFLSFLLIKNKHLFIPRLRVSDPHRFNADPDPTFFLIADPDPGFEIN